MGARDLHHRSAPQASPSFTRTRRASRCGSPDAPSRIRFSSSVRIHGSLPHAASRSSVGLATLDCDGRMAGLESSSHPGAEH